MEFYFECTRWLSSLSTVSISLPRRISPRCLHPRPTFLDDVNWGPHTAARSLYRELSRSDMGLAASAQLARQSGTVCRMNRGTKNYIVDVWTDTGHIFIFAGVLIAPWDLINSRFINAYICIVLYLYCVVFDARRSSPRILRSAQNSFSYACDHTMGNAPYTRVLIR